MTEQAQWEQQNHHIPPPTSTPFLLPQPFPPCLNVRYLINNSQTTLFLFFFFSNYKLKNFSSSFKSLFQCLPSSSGTFDGETAEMGRNELDLTLDSLYPCHLGCFATQKIQKREMLLSCSQLQSYITFNFLFYFICLNLMLFVRLHFNLDFQFQKQPLSYQKLLCNNSVM